MSKRVLTGLHFLQGDEACVEGALAAGCQLFAGYPITPATEISVRMSKRIFEVGGIFVQGADELDSLAIVIGAVWGGVERNDCDLWKWNLSHARKHWLCSDD